MKDRYEIRDKLGQGGLGAVYRAWDQSLKREVAIKRILMDEDGQAEEATRQMEQETGALAALQHPHIVTIYDVGRDDEGPFVVMEMIKGKTVDELVENAPLTWPDFRELVQQIMEGLVAAQDLDLVHRDLKPSNIMINWLPSGKFQAKIVDFGLAKFSEAPSAQTIDQNDSVYGSIFFMAPEQFERAPIGQRVDMYAIGCVYYFALTGVCPFQGDTGPQVMAAHLEHRVVPLAEARPDIPTWVADWVMWHINRLPEDRPENAREALKNFIELDIPATETMTTGPTSPDPETPPEPAKPQRPRLIIPGANPEPAPAQPAPEPPAEPAPAPAPQIAQPAPPPAPAQIEPPASIAPPAQPVPAPPPAQPVQPEPPAPAPAAEPTTPQPVPPTPEPAAAETPPEPVAQPETAAVPPPQSTQTAPQPLSPPEGAPPSIHTTGQQGDASAAQSAPDAPPPAAPVVPAQPAPPVVQATPTAPATDDAATSTVSTVKLATAKATGSPAPTKQNPLLTPSAAPASATPNPTPVAMPAAAAAPAPVALAAAPPAGAAPPAPGARPGQQPGGQPGMGNTTIGNAVTTKKGLGVGAKIAIASILAVLVIIVGSIVATTMSGNKDTERYNELVKLAADPSAKELPVSEDDLNILLGVVNGNNTRDRETVYRALYLAKATDGTDVDGAIAQYATTGTIKDDVRVDLLERVLFKRKDPSIVQPLLEYARSTDNERGAAAALKAVRNLATENELGDFLQVIQFNSSNSIRTAAGKAAAEILKKTKDPEGQAAIIASASEGSVNDDSRRAMIRLLGYTGGDRAKEVVTGVLEGDNDLDKLAALEALQHWRDDSMFEELVAFLEDQTDQKIRPKAFDAAYRFLTDKEKSKARDALDSEDYWKMLAEAAKTDNEQYKVISGLAQTEASDWALVIVEYFVTEAESDKVITRAEKAIDYIREQMRLKGDGD